MLLSLLWCSPVLSCVGLWSTKNKINLPPDLWWHLSFVHGFRDRQKVLVFFAWGEIFFCLTSTKRRLSVFSLPSSNIYLSSVSPSSLSSASAAFLLLLFIHWHFAQVSAWGLSQTCATLQRVCKGSEGIVAITHFEHTTSFKEKKREEGEERGYKVSLWVEFVMSRCVVSCHVSCHTK